MSRIATVWANPWREWNPLSREMDRLLQSEWWTPARRRTEFPPINAWESETGYVLAAELPGIDPERLDVSVEKDSLTISCARTGEPAGDGNGSNYIRRERWYESVTRTIELPFDVDPEKCEATYEKGVLTVKLQRAPQYQPKKLTVKSG